MPKQKQITITFIISGGKGQSIDAYPSQRLSELRKKVARKLLLSKDKVIIFTYKNKDVFQDQQTLADLQITDKSIVYIRLVEKINLQTSHKLGQGKMKKSVQLKKQTAILQSIQIKSPSSKELIEKSLSQSHQNLIMQQNRNIQQKKLNIAIFMADKQYNFYVSPQSNIIQLKNLISERLNLAHQKAIVLKLGQVELLNEKTIKNYQINQDQPLSCSFGQSHVSNYIIDSYENNKIQQIRVKIHSQSQKGFVQSNQTSFLFPRILQNSHQTQQFAGQQWFQNKKNDNLFLNKFQGLLNLNCDMKKSQIIDDDDQQYTAEESNSQYKSPLTPQYAFNSKNFSTPYTPSFDMNVNNRKTFSLFQKSQVVSKVWNGEIIETQSIAFIQEDQNFLFQSQFQVCFLNCSDNCRKQYLFECNNQVKMQDIKRTLAKLQKISQQYIQIQFQENILGKLNEQNFLIVDYSTVSKNRQLNWIYKTGGKTKE